jgi:hypothetical protein
LRQFRLYQSLSRTFRAPVPDWKAEIRTIISTLAGLVALASVSAQAAPLPPAKAIPVELGTAPPIELVREG